MKDLKILGSEEWCVFENLGIPAIKARVDSGAKTSSIQATNIRVFSKGTQEWVKFNVKPLQENRNITIECEALLIDRRMVKSSSGVSEERYVIKTTVTMGQETFDIELTLANRGAMEFRMLLGREAVVGRYVVNPALNFQIQNFDDVEINKKYAPYFKDKKELKIALLASNPELYGNKRIIEATEARGHKVVFLNIESVYLKLDAYSPEIRYRGKNILKEFDAIIPRIKPSLTSYGCALVRHFENLGVYCQNSAEAILQSRDKLYALQLFSKNDIHIPITGFAKSPIDTKDLIKMVNGAPSIVKLLDNTQGKRVELAKTIKAAESFVNASKSGNSTILAQEFIKEAKGQDIRCLVVNGRVVASIQRQAKKNAIKANTRQVVKTSIIKIRADEKKLVVRAVKALHLTVASVVLIRSNKGPLIMEVNSSPGLEGIEKATGKDIANELIVAIEKKLKFSR